MVLEGVIGSGSTSAIGSPVVQNGFGWAGGQRGWAAVRGGNHAV